MIVIWWTSVLTTFNEQIMPDVNTNSVKRVPVIVSIAQGSHRDSE